MHNTIFDYPAKTFSQGWSSCFAKKTTKISEMTSKVGGCTNFFPVRYMNTFSFFRKFTLLSVDVT